MNNHRCKLLVIVCLVMWLFAGSPVVWSQDATHSAHSSSSVQHILYGLAAKFKKRAIANKSAAIRKAYIHGWPISAELTGGGFKELQKLGPDGTPLYKVTYNDMVVKTSRADFLTDGTGFDFGVDGTAMTIGIWDSGKALPEHQEFGDRIVFGDRSKRISGHATHVMGTALAAGVDPKAQGVAFNATGLSFDWNKDEGEAAEQAAEGLLISNHSYGLSGRNLPDWYFGSYINQAQDWDEIMHAAPYYLMVTAAGNTRYLNYNDSPLVGTSADGYDLLLGFALSKNGITVAAADQVNMDSNGNLLGAEIANFSNFGPADDGRIKPDITGSGVDVYSTYDKDADSYRVLSGTSMASPGVAASLLLLQQYHYVAFGNYMRAATLKGLALHTADEAGEHPGPDPKYGWGILNSKRAAETLDAKDVNSKVEEHALAQGGNYTVVVNAEGGVPLAVSLSWTDPAYPDAINGKVNDATPVLVNDLDLRVYKDGSPYLPWKLSLSDLGGGAVRGDNLVDPFEKIEIPDAEGEYTIVVTHKGRLASTVQNFSLIVTGISDSQCSVVAPENTSVDQIGQDMASVSWSPVDEAFYEVRYRAEGDEQWQTELVADHSVELANLLADTGYEVQVRSLCTEIMGSDFSETIFFRTEAAQTEEETTTDPGNTGDGTSGAGDNAGSGEGTDGTDGTDPNGGTDGSGSTDNTGDGTTGTGDNAGSGEGTDGSGGTNPDGGTDGSGSTDNTGDGTTGTGDNAGNGDGTDGSSGTNPEGSTEGSGSTGNTGDGTTGTGDNAGSGEGTDGSGGTDSDGSTDGSDVNDGGGADSGSNPGDGADGLPQYPDTDLPPFLDNPEDQFTGGMDHVGGALDPDKNNTSDELEDPAIAHTPSGEIVLVGSRSRLGPYYLVDLLGRVLKTGADASQPIPVNELSDGFYILAFEVDGVYKAKKFAK